MDMGSVNGNQFHRSDVTPPWAREVFGTPGIVDGMLQEVANGKDVQQAWLEAVEEMQQTVEVWKSMHPEWKSKGCN